jgi:quercetin dioxygenase-like cupin family protein
LDIETIRRDWHDRGFSCDLWTDPPGQRWEGYVHTTDELVMILEGDVEFEIEGICHRPAPGQELVIPAGAEHSVRNLGQTGSRWLYGYGRHRNA